MWYEALIDGGYLPDVLIRQGIRRLLATRIQGLYQGDDEARFRYKLNFINGLKRMPIAVDTDKANDQHYEVSPEFMKLMMGDHVKYSCGLYVDDTTSLSEAEESMMEVYCQRAKLADGQRILDLGCGWGSLALYMAKKYPNAKITGFSNSYSQADYICRQVSERGLTNVQVTTGNIVDFEWDKPREFDRIVTIEMIEHMKNYAQLFAKVSRWLTPDGYMFAETLSHREVPYHFDVGEEDSWLARYFFTGGCMPSRDLYLYFQDHLQLVDQWYLNGTHFNKTGEAWLINLDRHSEEALVALTRIYASKELAALDFTSARTIAYKWLQRWRVYLMAVSEMYAFGNYQEWGITHHLFQNRRRPVLPLQA